MIKTITNQAKAAAKAAVLSPLELGRDAARQVTGIENLARPTGDNYIERQRQEEQRHEQEKQQIIAKERTLMSELEGELAKIRQERQEVDARRKQQEQQLTQRMQEENAQGAPIEGGGGKSQKGPMGAMGKAKKAVNELFKRTTKRAEQGKQGSG